MPTRCGADAELERLRAGVLVPPYSVRRPRRRVARALRPTIGLLTCLIWLVSPALAQERSGSASESSDRASPPPEALEHYERGRQEYLAGRYREALYELRAALELDPSSPNLVYNVARVYEDLGELDQAIRYYRRYRGLLPREAGDERDKTAKIVRRLEGARDEQAQAKAAALRERGGLRSPNEQPPIQSSPGNGRADLAFWLVAGTGVALAAGGGVTGWFALEREQQLSDFVLGKDGSFDRREQLRKQANRFALASDVMSVAAGTAILSAAILFFSRSSEPSPSRPPSARVALLPSRHGAQLQWEGRF